MKIVELFMNISNPNEHFLNCIQKLRCREWTTVDFHSDTQHNIMNNCYYEFKNNTKLLYLKNDSEQRI